MLLLHFLIGGDRYALDCRDVREVVPLATLRDIPKAPESIAGLLRYRGHVVPVIDLCVLAGRGPAPRILSTRIIIARFADQDGAERTLGLIAERVVDAGRPPEEPPEPSGIAIREAPYLGDVISGPEGITQFLRVSDLLPPDVQKMLFLAAEEARSK